MVPITTTMGSENRPPEESTLIPHISLGQMTGEIRDYLVVATPFDHFWTDDWSPGFYRAQARLGFIAVATEGPADVGNVLIPELQREYAVLDWPDLRIDHGVQKIIDRGRLQREEVRLRIDTDPGAVLDRLAENWGERTWLVPEYVRLVKALAAPEEIARDTGFRILGTSLFAGEESVAGELGYAVGRAYVSLSGFFRRGRREWNHFGKLQMVLLARRLQSAGFAFWNLGHPYMDYKTQLGAQIVPREEFLRRWDTAAAAELPGICTNGFEALPAENLLST